MRHSPGCWLSSCTPLGLPEPVARKAGTAGFEGAAARQRAAATRLADLVLRAGGVRAGRATGQRGPGQEPARPA
jgi:hypothetical protein